MLLHIVYFGDPILRKKTAPVTEINEEVRQLVADMRQTMAEYDGIGLAAPQIGKSLALFVTQVPIEKEEGVWEEGVFRVFINPKLSQPSHQRGVREEGCLSIPKVYAPVERPISITVEAQDLDGNWFKEEFSDLEARAIMHENDHINGVLFIDRVSPKLKPEIARKVKKLFPKS